MARKITREEVASLRYEIIEIFTPSTPVNIADLFVGRIKQMTQLLDAIAEPGRHAIIYGERGVGKSSIANVIQYWVPATNRRLFFLRIPCDPSDNFTSVWKKIFREIQREATYNGKDLTYSADELYPDKIYPYDVVRELKRFRTNDIPVFVIDEFNELDDPEAPTLMANTLKGLSDDNINSTVIIVGVANSINQLFEKHESIDRCCEEVPMPRMSNPELGEILDKRLAQLSVDIDRDARMKIIVLARGLPMYVHSLGKLACLKAVTDLRGSILGEDVDKAIEDMLRSSEQSLKAKYEKAIFSNQANLFRQVLLACALARVDDSGYFAPAAVREPLEKILNKAMEIAQYQSHLNGFISAKRGHILERTGVERSYRFKFKDPAMQPFVLMRGMVDGHVSSNLGTILSFPEQTELFSTMP